MASRSRRTAAATITEADVHGNLWRGFENFLLGRDANDAITFTQRICGVCPVPHGMTSTYAVDAVLGYSRGHITFADARPTAPTATVCRRRRSTSATWCSRPEFLMSSITHFYHLAAPSYVQGPAIPPWTPYFDEQLLHRTLLQNPGGTAAASAHRPGRAASPQHLWDAVILSYVKALRIRRLTFEAGALFAGRMPMTSCFVAGGVTDDGTENLTAKLRQVREHHRRSRRVHRPGVRADRARARRAVPELRQRRTTTVASRLRRRSRSLPRRGARSPMRRRHDCNRRYASRRRPVTTLAAPGSNFTAVATRPQVYADVARWRHALRADQPDRGHRALALRHLQRRRRGLHG